MISLRSKTPGAAGRSIPPQASRLVIAGILIGAALLGACIIGPKQDDPSAASVPTSDLDAAVAADTGRVGPESETGLFEDAAPPAPLDAAAVDGGGTPGTDRCGDAAIDGDTGDASGDGGGCGNGDAASDATIEGGGDSLVVGG